MERNVYRTLFSRLKNDREMRQCNDQVLALSKTAKEIYEYTDSRTQEIGHMHLTGHEVAYCRILLEYDKGAVQMPLLPRPE